MLSIFAGDCLDWLAAMPDASADVTMADPPYSEHVHARSRSGNSKTLRNPNGSRSARKAPLSRDLGFASLTPTLQRDVACEMARVTRRWINVFCDVEQVSPWIYALQGAGLDYVRTCAWVKPNCSPQFTGDRPGSGFEAVVCAHRKGMKRWNGGGHRGVFVHNIENGRGGSRLHKTEKPIPLMMELIELFSERDELVIDPFAGSGSTGIACLRTGRRFAGAELDEAMAHTANERIEAEREHSTIAARRACQSPLFGDVPS